MVLLFTRVPLLAGQDFNTCAHRELAFPPSAKNARGLMVIIVPMRRARFGALLALPLNRRESVRSERGCRR